ncbi:hypothetical protein Zmor_008384 [Zophobas morio]|uniref:Uncharacterized protein n=1 Tax=Zophobas morio TaxID=2755281 RepID=A0AA38J146_9CUCU|nr:hypothetical protein Zmor_008384 [Zophobas morio]
MEVEMPSKSCSECLELILPKITAQAAAASNNLLPQTYKKGYEMKLMNGRAEHKFTSSLETILMAHFDKINAKIKPSSLWTISIRCLEVR